MADLIIGIILIAAVGSAAAYIIKEKKRGVKCIGCPAGCTCGSKGGCSGHCDSKI